MWTIGLKTRLFGKVDQAPGIGYVATEFFHVGYIPIVPLQTWLVVGRSETDVFFFQSWRGVPIPRSWKSVCYAWVRTPLLVCGLGGMLFAWLRFNGKPHESPFSLSELLTWFAVSALFIAAFAFTYWLSQANRRRAREMELLIEEAERAAEGIPSTARSLGNPQFEQVCSLPHRPASEPPNVSWQDFVSNSEALQNELHQLSQTLPPNVKPHQLAPKTDDNPELGQTFGTVVLSRGPGFLERAFCTLVILAGLIAPPLGALVLVLPPERTRSVVEINPREPNAHLFLGVLLLCVGGLCLALGGGLMLLFRNSSKTRLIVFENGLLFEQRGQTDRIAWSEIEGLGVNNATGRPLYELSIPHRAPIVISAGHGPDTIALMSHVEYRIAQANLLACLEAICQGNRKSLGVIQLDRIGLTAPEVFTPWHEISRVFADDVTVFVDWSGSKTCVEIPYDEVSMPRLALALARLLMAEHGRLPVLDDGHFRHG